VLWKIKAPQGLSSSSFVDEDAGVVLLQTTHSPDVYRTWELRSGQGLAPQIAEVPLSGWPIARLAGRSYVYDQNAGVLRWLNDLGSQDGLDLGLDQAEKKTALFSFSPAGDIVLGSSANGYCWLTKWDSNKVRLFRHKIPFSQRGGMRGPILAPDGGIFVNLEFSKITYSEYKVAKFDIDGRFLWVTQGGSWHALIPTSDGGVYVSPLHIGIGGTYSRLSAGGFPESGFTWSSGHSLPLFDLDEEPYEIPAAFHGAVLALLADGGMLMWGSGPLIHRVSCMGATLWSIRDPGSTPLVGDGILYTVTYEATAPGTAWFQGIDLGIPLLNAPMIRRARVYRPRREQHHPFVSIAHYSRQSGAVLNFSTRRDRLYAIEAARSAGQPWVELDRVSGRSGGLQFIDRAATNTPLRLYRVVELSGQ